MGTMNTRKVHRYKCLYMDIAERVAQMSHAQRLKVGAVIVRDGRIISMGWNGMPAGWDNECEQDLWHAASEDVERVTRAEVLHAESNAISKLARSIESGLDAEMYCTHNPCMECAKLIYQSGIKKVYYKTEYRDHGGIGFFFILNTPFIPIEINLRSAIYLIYSLTSVSLRPSTRPIV